MEYLRNNLEMIKTKSADIYAKLNEYLQKNPNKWDFSDKFKIVVCRDGTNTVEVCDGEKRICLNSIYNSSREAGIWAEKYKNVPEITSFIMFGMGNGVFFNAIKKHIKISACIMFFEPDMELFLFCLKYFNLHEILSDKRLSLYINGINENDFYMDLSGRINWAMLPTQLICSHPSYDRLYKEEYLKYEFVLEQLKTALITNKNTSLAYAKKFTVNAINNLRNIKNSNYISEFI